MRYRFIGVLLVILFTLLFLEIRFNTFDTIDLSNIQEKGIMERHVSNYWIAGTILNTRLNGFWSSKGFNVRYLQKGTEWKKQRINNIIVYESFNKNLLKPGKFEIYKSALRVPTNIYVAIDEFLCSIFGKCSNLNLFITINSAMFALVLVLFCYWTIIEFGYISVIFVFGGLIANHWLIRIGQLPNFALFIRFLPFIMGLIVLRFYEHKEKNIKLGNVFFLFFLLMSLNQSIDYEFTPVVMISAILPFFYFSVSRNWNKIFTLKIILTASLACIFSFLVLFLIHIYLVSLIEGSYLKAIDYFQYSFFKRSNSLQNINLSASEIKCANAKFWDVFLNLSEKKDLIAGFNAKELIIGTTFSVSIVFSLSKAIEIPKYKLRKYLALNIILILALIGAVANIYIFKSHVACHQQLDYIFWCLPSTLIMTLVIGYSIQNIIIFMFNKKNTKFLAHLIFFC